MNEKVAPGVWAEEGKIASAEEAARIVSELAREAAASGTFGIGGMLVKANGEIVAKAKNAVVREDRAKDPTAHVERQLVDWHHKNASRLGLPSPDQLTIVSSLDPCAMCTGAILRSGLKAIAVAPDETAGVLTYLTACERDEFQGRALALVARNISVFDVASAAEPDPAGNVLGGSIARSTRDSCLSAFVGSLGEVRSSIGERKWYELGLTAQYAFNRLRMDGILQIGSSRSNARELVNRFARRYPLPKGFSAVEPCVNLGDDTLQTSLKHLFPSEDSVALADGAGEIFLVVETRQTSAARNSVVELVRGYPRLRAKVLERLEAQLPHPRVCSAVRPWGPERFEDAFLEFGAMGSFLEAERQNVKFPLLLFAAAQQPPERWLDVLPKFYRDIGVDAGAIDPPDMRFARHGHASANSAADGDWAPGLSWPRAK